MNLISFFLAFNLVDFVLNHWILLLVSAVLVLLIILSLKIKRFFPYEEVRIAAWVTFLVTLVVIHFSYWTFGYGRQFWEGVFIESHGMFLDLLIISMFLFYLQKKSELNRRKQDKIETWQEQIRDFRGWKNEEAVHRIVGNIRRLNREGKHALNLQDTYLVNANLTRADLRRSYLFGSDMRYADFREANLSETDLFDLFTPANLSNSLLQRANFTGARLINVVFDGADLTKTVFYKALLSGASFKNAKIDKTDFKDADLSEADLRTISLEHVDRFCWAKTLHNAKMAPEFEKTIKEKCPQLLEGPKE